MKKKTSSLENKYQLDTAVREELYDFIVEE